MMNGGLIAKKKSSMGVESAKTKKMREIRDEVLKLKESPLYEYRTKNKYFPVIGEGNHDAAIMFIGEAPGKNEAEQAKPFCGAAGKILDECLASVGITRADVYVTNIVKDRPPENRDPTPQEIELYAPFLDRQIALIAPKVIATLGRFSMDYLLTKYNLGAQQISKVHGTVFDAGDFKIVPLYHPAAALYTRSLLDTLTEDFKVLKKFYDEK